MGCGHAINSTISTVIASRRHVMTLWDDQRLRSSVLGDFVVRRTRTRLANSSFTVAGPAAWNLLPVSIRNTNSLFVVNSKLTYFPHWIDYRICAAYIVFIVYCL